MSFTRFCVALTVAFLSVHADFRFSTTHGDYMVLQQFPFKSQVWGFSTASQDNVKVTLTRDSDNQVIETVYAMSEGNDSIWVAQFTPICAIIVLRCEIAGQLSPFFSN